MSNPIRVLSTKYFARRAKRAKLAEAGDVWLLDVYAKSDQSDLTPEQTKRAQRAIHELEAAYE
jgi:hypothetical protein